MKPNVIPLFAHKDGIALDDVVNANALRMANEICVIAKLRPGTPYLRLADAQDKCRRAWLDTYLDYVAMYTRTLSA